MKINFRLFHVEQIIENAISSIKQWKIAPWIIISHVPRGTIRKLSFWLYGFSAFILSCFTWNNIACSMLHALCSIYVLWLMFHVKHHKDTLKKISKFSSHQQYNHTTREAKTAHKASFQNYPLFKPKNSSWIMQYKAWRKNAQIRNPSQKKTLVVRFSYFFSVPRETSHKTHNLEYRTKKQTI